MANKPENLKPFKEGEDSRRHKKQKGEISAKTKAYNFLQDYFRYKQKKGISEEEAINEIMEKFDKLSNRNPKILLEIANRVYGKVAENLNLEGDIKVELVKYVEDTGSLQIPAEGVSVEPSESNGESKTGGSSVAQEKWQG